jgi:FkbM family methyltransferase
MTTPEPRPRSVPEFRDIAAALPGWRPGCIFDVGANGGQSATAYAGHFPDAAIHAFEPVPEAFALLRRAAASHPNITAHQLALSSAPGLATMAARGSSTRNRILPGGAPAGGDTIAVRAAPGHLVAQELGCADIGFLKIDTEGHDLDVLIGFAPLLPRIDFVEVEAAMNPYNQTHVPFRILEDFLRHAGFLLFRLYEQRLEFHKGGRPVLRRANPVFIHQRLADTTGIR